MTTAKQVQALMKPLVERHSDLAIVGRYVFLHPIQHFVRGIYIDRSLDKDAFDPDWGVTMLFRPGNSLATAWETYISAPKVGVWNINRPTTQQDMIRQIEDNALPVLRQITTMDEFVAFASDERFPGRSWKAWSLTRLIFQAALGDLDAARATCDKLSELRYIPRDTASREIHLTIIEGLAPLLERNDRTAIGNLLRAWEAARVKKHKMEKYWQPTPFPLELEAPAQGALPSRP
ncbi:hypothetical protein [Azorhizobium sp. AG788]|uniref:hypothetical protein n=1 Tax=Azorhizobium sp. AG788 TaxID=2183897 RepID=UPI00313958AA